MNNEQNFQNSMRAVTPVKLRIYFVGPYIVHSIDARNVAIPPV